MKKSVTATKMSSGFISDKQQQFVIMWQMVPMFENVFSGFKNWQFADFKGSKVDLSELNQIF